MAQLIEGFEGLHASEVSVTALGRTHCGVLTHSAELHAGQSRGLTQTLANPDAGRHRQDHEQQYVREIATYTLTGGTPATLRLT